MRLTELEPQFLRFEERIETQKRHKADGYMDDPAHVHTDECWEDYTGPQQYFPMVYTLADAQGIEFLCPKCFAENGGRVGTHAVICWSRSRGVPDHAHPAPGRWMLEGTGYHDLTLNGDPPGNARSVLLLGGCDWHGFITNGEVT